MCTLGWLFFGGSGLTAILCCGRGVVVVVLIGLLVVVVVVVVVVEVVVGFGVLVVCGTGVVEDRPDG